MKLLDHEKNNLHLRLDRPSHDTESKSSWQINVDLSSDDQTNSYMRKVHGYDNYDYPLLPSMRYGVNIKKEKRKRRRRGITSNICIYLEILLETGGEIIQK